MEAQESELQRDWETKLATQGLSMEAGHDPHIMCYGYDATREGKLDMVYNEHGFSLPAFQWQVEHRLAESHHSSTAAQRMRKLSASRSSAKQQLKAKIWGEK